LYIIAETLFDGVSEGDILALRQYLITMYQFENKKPFRIQNRIDGEFRKSVLEFVSNYLKVNIIFIHLPSSETVPSCEQ
jgi:hypothetical protein